MAVFDGVHYILSPSLPPHRRHELVSILDLNGATSVGPYTHLIALGGSYSHHDKQHAESANTTLKVVSDKWVDRSIVMGKIQSEQYYSPDPAMIFSGIVACATDLPTSDVEVLSAGVTALGGQWRIGLTRDVTHLFALRPGSDKYNTALHFAPHTRMSIVTPHWFDDSVRLGRRLPETPYLWPDPIVLRPGTALTLDEDAINNGDLKRKKPRTSDITGEDFVVSGAGEKEKVWGGRKVLLSRSLELSESQRAAVNAGITRSGGVVVKAEGIDDDEAEERAVDTCDVFVTRWRSGKAYFKAARASRLIGTLTWLFNVESSGTLHSPLDSLLWYPVPRGGIPGLAGCEISITNYTGTARDYLKRLISLTGAKFTPSLSMDNKVLIAGFQPSPKTTRALAWSIPVVNHTWLEDCIVEWRALTVGLERYIVFPPGIDFGKVLMGADGGGSSSANENTTTLVGGVLPGGRGVGIVDVECEEARDTEYTRSIEINASQEDAIIRGIDAAETGVGKGTPAEKGRGRSTDRVLRTKQSPARSRSRSTRSARVAQSKEPVFRDTYEDRIIDLPDNDDSDARTTKSKRRGPSIKGSPVSKPNPSLGTTRLQSTSKPSSLRALPPGTSTSTREVEAVLTYDDDLDGVPEVAHMDDNVMDVDEDAPKNTKTGRAKLTNKVEPNSKGKGRAVPHPQSDGSLSRDDDERSAARSKGKSMAKSNVKSSTTSLAPHRRSPVPAAGKPRPKLVRRNQTSSTANLTQSEPDEQSERRMDKSPSSVRQPKAKDVRSGDEIIQLDSDSEPAPPPGISRASTLTPIKSGMKPKSKSGHSQKLVDREEPSDKDFPTIHNKNKKAADGKATSSRKANTTAHEERSKHAAQPDVADSTKERRLSTLSSSPPPPSAKTMTTPKRSVSVLVPSLPDEYFTPGGSKVKRAMEKENTDIENSRVPVSNRRPAVAEGASSSKGKLAVADRSPDAAGKKQMASPSRLKGHRSEASVVDEGDGYVSADTFATMSVRGGPRRSAANKATVKLRDAVMPDVIDYEKERKNQKRRRSAGGRSLFSLGEDDVAESRLVKKRKVEGEGAKADTKGKGKKVKPQEEDEEQEVELAVAIPKEKPKLTKGKGGLQKTASSDMNTPETRTIRLMITGVTLSDEVIKGLSKLGVRMTTKSTDCTHLVAKGIVRTEKFLCAMSVSPYVLKEEWVNASIQSGKLLPEHDYLLSDAAAEMKWNFKFSEALERSKQKGCGSQLFKQLSFYLTPKVPIDNKLLKAVVSSAGGQIQNATPTVRILKAKANRYVISCPEDVSIWRPLVDEGYKIYSTELILRAVLKQEIEWDNAECIVSGSNS
ncbi:hypothetical protein BKA82DRAFT_1000669 [Pisolithus tinctorius]|uniref:BRCT domain-containing protein n=1 Tax=Pisolithus tinctorius Marx 270 TaxID=870435 RepID=A0A0C3PAC3_PISTI|nr:hypothetical protein BKA82DRAFT_1000669 [Pisolithus tinctorius]KIO04539.1 hypothetical protein M404DRAFT_1000669 [Pisolithus tinctorius Marx 270]